MNPAFDSLKKTPADEDLPPGAGGTYYGGPLANPTPPKPTPTPPEKKRP